MIEAVKHGFANYARFDGRTGRATFWWWVLAVFLAVIVASFLDGSLARGHMAPITALLTLILFLPNLAMSVRRLHDANQTGWWVLVGLVPLFGAMLLIVLYLLPSHPAGERFDAPGPAPMPPEPPPAA
jgi:uncharacterized membrane protein YhaH (DUF805 family)